MKMDGKILVTGAGGYTGGALARRLAEAGHDVRGTVRPGGGAAELERAGVEVVRGDIASADDVRMMVAGCSHVFHIAALYRRADATDEEYRRINAGGTRLLLEASREAGVKKFVHCSTIGVSGHVSGPPADEEAPYNPGDIYQRTKMEGEMAALEYFRGGRLNGVVVRPAGIYGPGDTRFLKVFKMINRGVFVVLGSGRTTLHMVYIDDLVDGFIMAMEKDVPSGEVFIIGGDGFVSLNDFLSLIAGVLGVKPPRIRLPLWPFQLLGSLVEGICVPLGLKPPIYRRRVDFFAKSRAFDISKAKRVLGYAPKVSLAEGVRRTADWYRGRGML